MPTSQYCRRDAWAKHEKLSQTEAKWLYVQALMKVRGVYLTSSRRLTPSQVLRRYSDKTVAMDFVRELESYDVHDVEVIRSCMSI